MLGMVEKVGRAICRSMLQDPDIDYEVHHQDGLVKGWKMYESEAIAAIGAMQVMWQPIETAPKDGTIIDGHGYVKGQMIGHNHRIPYVAFRHVSKESGIIVGKEWIEVHTGAEVILTHWMPIPSPPETGGAT